MIFSLERSPCCNLGISLVGKLSVDLVGSAIGGLSGCMACGLDSWWVKVWLSIWEKSLMWSGELV